METVQINKQKAVYELLDIKPSTIIEEVDGLRIEIIFAVRQYGRIRILRDIEPIAVGDEITFMRDIYYEDGKRDIIRTAVKVKSVEIDRGVKRLVYIIHTTLPEYRTLSLPTDFNLFSIKASKDECEKKFDAYIPEEGGYLTVNLDDGIGYFDAVDYHTGETPFFVFKFSAPHNIFAQDIAQVNQNSEAFFISVRDENGVKIGELNGLSIPFEDISSAITSADTITLTDEKTCDLEEDMHIYTYNYMRDNFSRTKIMFTGATTNLMNGSFYETVIFLLNNGKRFVPNFNPFYYYGFDYNDTTKSCHLWHDIWWDVYETKTGRYNVYINNGPSNCFVGKETGYWKLPTLQLKSESDSIGNEDEQQGAYVDEIISQAIPDVIDMERLKYKPVIDTDNGGYKFAKNIIFDFHFRKRQEVDGNSKPYPVYLDGWNIPIEDEPKTWWNGFNYDGTIFSRPIFKEFMEASGHTSDLLGYLNFTDDDVYYRKSKLAKTFVRLSFYTSPDPVEQKLLYYSTIFMDTTALYGKYMKQYMNKTEGEDADSELPIVFYPDNSASARLDTELVIKDEFNTEKSSEGFNIYLFKDDAMGVNSARTIYMKVEFNHAGNGKTIPMILWPKQGLFGDEDTDEDNILGEPSTTLLEPNLILGDSIISDPSACAIPSEGFSAEDGIIPLCPNCDTTDNACNSDDGIEICNGNDGIEGCNIVATGQCTVPLEAFAATDEIQPICLICDTGGSDGGCTIDGGCGSVICTDEICVYPDCSQVACLDAQPCRLVCFDACTKDAICGHQVDHICAFPDCSNDCGGTDCECDGDCSEDGVTPTGAYIPVKISNYLKSLYIPIEIRYVDGEYIYSIPDAEKSIKDNNIRLVLFEPKIDNTEDL